MTFPTTQYIFSRSNLNLMDVRLAHVTQVGQQNVSRYDNNRVLEHVSAVRLAFLHFIHCHREKLLQVSALSVQVSD